MNFQIQNQRPAELSPIIPIAPIGFIDVQELVKNRYIKPLCQPLTPNAAVSMTVDGTTITEDDVAYHLAYAIDPSTCGNPAMMNKVDEFSRNFLQHTLIRYDYNAPLSVNETFAIQAGMKAKLPFPEKSARRQVIYTIKGDLIPTCREFLNGTTSTDCLFANFAFYTRCQSLGVYFKTAQDFEDFKTFCNSQAAVFQAVMPVETTRILNDFYKLDLNRLTESLALGTNVSDMSFARFLHNCIMEYTKHVQPDCYGLFPFSMLDTLTPKSVIFVNIDRHAHANARDIAKEWELINRSIQNKIHMVSRKSLKKLTAAARAADGISADFSRANDTTVRHANMPFSTTAPDSKTMIMRVKSIASKLTRINRSDNSYKAVKMSFARPNRRDPDNFNLQGKSVSTHYKPDIHIYLDCSGSISEKQYRAAIQSLIYMAKELNVNLYFNSFSHVMSQCTRIRVEGKSLNEIYRNFLKIEKVSGGTNFEQIWQYIDQSPKRRRELSLCVTDFGYYAPNNYTHHPDRLFYLPVDYSDWKSIMSMARSFVNSMQHIDPCCRRKILF